MGRFPTASQEDRLAERGGGVAIVSREGQTLASLPAPAGYSLSHFAAQSEPVLVGQGESPHGGWQDWHFAVRGTGEQLRRLGPVY